MKLTNLLCINVILTCLLVGIQCVPTPTDTGTGDTQGNQQDDTGQQNGNDSSGLIELLAAPVFVVEDGIRVDNAGIAKAGYNSDASVGGVGTYIYYGDMSDNPMPGPIYAFSADGLTFGEPQPLERIPGGCPDGSEAVKYIGHLERLELPDQSGWRMYFLEQHRGPGQVPVFDAFTSAFSEDGASFCREDVNCYDLGPNDNNSMGIYTTFAAEHSEQPQVVLLYLGDLANVNNTRRAVSDGDGTSFTWERDNVLGDAGRRSSELYVDITTVPTKIAGVRRLYAMQGAGAIYSFLTNDDGQTFEMEDGYRVSARDFDVAVSDGEAVCGLFDPTILQYRDESNNIVLTRMYVTGSIWDSTATWGGDGESGNCADIEPCGTRIEHADCQNRQAIFSAISSE